MVAWLERGLVNHLTSLVTNRGTQSINPEENYCAGQAYRLIDGRHSSRVDSVVAVSLVTSNLWDLGDFHAANCIQVATSLQKFPLAADLETLL